MSTNQWKKSTTQLISSMRDSLPWRCTRACGHAGGGGFRSIALEQLERRVDSRIARGQCLACTQVVEIDRHAIDVFEDMIRVDAVAIDGTARRREVAGRRELDGAAFGERHHGLHRTLAERAAT